MNLRVATPELISQRVRSVLKERPQAEVLAVRAEPRWNAGDLDVDGRRVKVAPCISPLAVRTELAAWEDRTVSPGNGDLLVVVCDLSDTDLGTDVLARITPNRLLSLEPWDAVRGLFGVTRIDAAFGKKEDDWIAAALLAHVTAERAAALKVGTTLTIDAAYAALAQAIFGASALTVDDLLAAAARQANFGELSGADDDTRAGLLAALGRTSGKVGELVADIVRAGHGAELVSIGLAARSVYGDGSDDGGKAAGKFEAYCGAASIDPQVALVLAARCEDTVGTLRARHLDRANQLTALADQLASSWDATHPGASPLLPSGFAARITQAVAGLSAVLDALDAAADDAGLAGPLADLRSRIAAVRDHVEAASPLGARRTAHLEMASRLVTWLAAPQLEPLVDAKSFEDAAVRYRRDSAWVDRARRRLWRGDDDSEVAAVYKSVLDRVVARRRDENRRFATLLAAWGDSPSDPAALAKHGLVTVEHVVPTVLPSFGDLPVLFLVLDGCGLPSFLELAPQLVPAGFRELGRSVGQASPVRVAGIAALPTVTNVSRASLIAGTLTTGTRDVETKGFVAHPKLGGSAACFHQSELLGAAGAALAPDVQAALGPEGPRFVCVVVNTIDDELRKGTFTEELRLGDLAAVTSVLEAARNAGRAVVISADHGHVLAQPDDGGTGTFQGGGSGGERWREADRDPNETEVQLRGPRVLRGGEAGVLAPWEDDFRYGAKAGGYHGGASPEEALVPVAVFLPAGLPVPSGWDVYAEAAPLWWELRIAAAETVAPAEPAKKPKPAPENQPSMFTPEEVTAVPAPAGPAVLAQPPWLDDIVASEVWKAQRSLAGRGALPDDRARELLAAAARRGGVASFAVLAAESSYPPARLPGVLANLARMLNVDGYAVLEVDLVAQEVRLELALLNQQFQIEVTE